MHHFLLTVFSGADNKTWDLGRILWAKISFVYCALTVFQVAKTGTFAAQDWAIGAGVILAGGGGALGLKANAEPKAEGDTNLNAKIDKKLEKGFGE